MDKQLHDINTVCKMLGVTSRTLRFWEEKGLICSKKAVSGRRQYTDEQIEAIKKVITLRALSNARRRHMPLLKRDGGKSLFCVTHWRLLIMAGTYILPKFPCLQTSKTNMRK